MAKYDGYQARLETMVTELQTEWGGPAARVKPEIQSRVARQLHQHPEQAAQVRYDRQHTGFARVIVVTEEDLRRLDVPLPLEPRPSGSDSP